jgi:glutamate-1-semialdehyde 2,1-aminomutase
MKRSTGQKLYEKAKRIIPGGTQLLSKRPERFLPEQWPVYYKRARGADVWDLDDRRYIDISSSGISSCVLGFADPDVGEAVIGAVRDGAMSTLNCPEEIELAELLIELHPWAEMVRYTRSGGEMMAVAVRIARAATGREKIAFCGYHGWHDWYLAANLGEDTALDGHLLPGLKPAGVPRGLAGTLLPFRYNKIEDLEAIVATHGNELAAIVMEPARDAGPAAGFLQDVRRIADRSGAALVFDEITSGFRLYCGGIHMHYGVQPDLAAFAKAMANGYPMAALIGRRSVMDAAQDTFISSTFWTEKIGPTAALAAIRKYRGKEVHRHQIAVGELVHKGWIAAARESGLEIQVKGIAPLVNFSFVHPQAPALATLFTQCMLERGYLAGPRCHATLAHDEQLIGVYLDDMQAAFAQVGAAAKSGKVEEELRGPVMQPDFVRLA